MNINRKRTRRGTNMVELLGVMAVIAILVGIAVGGISAARDTASETSARSDIKTYTTAIQQVLMMHPELMKITPTTHDDANELVVKYINEQLESAWQFECLAKPTGYTKESWSGGIATSAQKRDAWDNPYGLYVYYDDVAASASSVTYLKGVGGTYDPMVKSDSCMYIVVCSSGKNATGGPTGIEGGNIDVATRKIAKAEDMINNTDGIDDIGVIIRILNGETQIATFGLDSCDLGSLEGSMWIFGKPQVGECYDFPNLTPVESSKVSQGGSIDRFYDTTAFEGVRFNDSNKGKPHMAIGTWTATTTSINK